MTSDLKKFTRNCINCKAVFSIALTDEEFLRIKLEPITKTATCPEPKCGTKHSCTIRVNGNGTTIRCARV